MSNSPLVQGTLYSPNHSGRRNQKISKIAIHHTAGVINGWPLATIFAPESRQASANYCLGSDGKIMLGVDEANRAWTTSSSWCDNRAVTIEVGNSTGAPKWLVSDMVLNRLIDLVYDICKRNGIYPCTYTGDTKGTLVMHRWFAQTSCPGPYLSTKFSYIASEVTKRLASGKSSGKPSSKTSGDIYEVTVPALNVRAAATTNSKINTVVHKGERYTILSKSGKWGKLKSGAGYIYLDYTKLVSSKTSSSFSVGDKVKVVGSKYSTGENIPGWVKKKTHTISQISGDQALLGNKGGINSWVYLKDLKK